MPQIRDSDGTPAGGRADWRAVALELLPLAAPFLLIAAGLGVFVAFAAGLGWAKIGRANVGVAYAVARGAVMAALFLVVVWAVLAHGSDDLRATVPFWIMVAVWSITPLFSAAVVASVSRRPPRIAVPLRGSADDPRD